MTQSKESKLVRKLKDQLLFGVIVAFYTTTAIVQGTKRIYFETCRIPYQRTTLKTTGLYGYKRTDKS